MKKTGFLIIAAFVLFACAASGQNVAVRVSQANTYTGGFLNDFSAALLRAPVKTVATLPAAAAGNLNDIFLVTDGSSASDCIVGGGTTRVLCASTGMIWTPLTVANAVLGGSAIPATAFLIPVASGVAATLGISTTKLNAGKFFPTADSITAVQVNKADGTTVVLNIDTTNSRLGIQQATPAAKLDVSGTADFGLYHNYQSSGASGLVYGQYKNGTVTGFVGLAGSLWGTGNVANSMNFGTQSNHSVVFATNDTVRMTIDGAGAAVNQKSFSSALYLTASNCSSSASPAVCADAPAGSVVVAAAASTVVVNTTAVTANSQIVLTYDAGLGTKLGVTCNVVEPALYGVTARVAATSFTVTSSAPITNPACFSYLVVN